jgi:hypothetical protein
MITADVHFAKGHSHNICEDYGLVHITDNLQMIIVADGCSTGYYSDIAARVLSHACRNALINWAKLNLQDRLKVFPNYSALGYEIIASSIAASKVMALGDLLSTLIVSFVANDKVHTYCYGDGYVIAKKKNESPIITKIDFIGNAPNYLWYRTNPARFTIPGCEMIINGEMYPRDHEAEFSISTENLEYVGIFTDGVASFLANKPVEGSRFGSKVTDMMAIDELMNIKSKNGNFVIRRMNRFLKQTLQDGFIHDDDITCAVMSFGDENESL